MSIAKSENEGIVIFSPNRKILRELESLGVEYTKFTVDTPNSTISNEDLRLLESDVRSFNPFDEPVTLYDVNSSNVSQIGATEYTFHPSTGVVLDPTMNLWCVYIIFKGNMTYKYFPVHDGVWQGLVKEAIGAARNSKIASVGSYYHHNIKVPADNNEYRCQRWDDIDGRWVDVLPKTRSGKK